MLIKAAIGDSYGAGFEYAPVDFVIANNNLAYVQHPRHAIAPGCYTDDIQMHIALIEVLLSGQWSRQALADAFVAAFKRDPRKGYAGRFYDFLCTCIDGADFLARIKPASDKSGGAMRTLAVGLLPDKKQVKSYAELQARITHDTDDGANAAIAAALTGHYFRFSLGKKAGLGAFLKGEVPGDWDTPWSGTVGEKGWMSVRAAITALQASNSMSAVLKQCIAFTGDVDTVATIALGAAALSSEFVDDLPQVLTDNLENGPYGRDFLQVLNERLMSAYPVT